MNILKSKTVLITGATSGIGEACARLFASEGCNLILFARRYEKLEKLKKELDKEIKVHIARVDVRNNNEIIKAIEGLSKDFEEINILINNAGLAIGMNEFYNDEIENWDAMIDTNIKGLLYTTKAVLPKMLGKRDGHIINLGSIAGHEAYPKGAGYCATKHAVNAITKSLRMDLLDQGIRVSSIDPGMVETEFSSVRFQGDLEKAKNVYKGLTPLTANDIAESILFIATRPAHVNINEMIIMPNQQANAFVNYRKS